MSAPITLELSFKSDVPKEVMFDLRNYLRQEIPGFEFQLKELPPLPGTMGGSPLIDMIIYGATVASVELTVHAALEMAGEQVAEKIKEIRDRFVKERKLGKLEISGSVKQGNSKSAFKIDDKKIHYFNDRQFSINPENTYILLVGCGTFEHKEINDIPPVENNLKALYDLFTDVQYFGVSAEHVTLSLNEHSDQIKDRLYEISRLKGIETFIFYYTGHGFCTDRDSYSLAGSNTQKKNDFINGGIDKEFIKNTILAQSPAKQKIAIIDACYSGILAQGGQANIFDNAVTGSYILTSSNAEEVSFYDKDETFTFFTGALLDTIKNDDNNESDVITLDNLYEGTSSLLKDRKLQQPTYKNGLNIDPAKFIISHNPAFSVEKEINRIRRLANIGKYDQASFEYKKLQKKYPDNTALHDEVREFEEKLMYSRFVKEGDENFYKSKNYAKAAENYEKALELREDMIIRERLQQCDELKKKKGRGFTIARKQVIAFIAIFIAVSVGYVVKQNLHAGEPEENPGHSTKNDSLTEATTKPVDPEIADTVRTVEESIVNPSTIVTNKVRVAPKLSNGKWGFADAAGNVLIPYQFSSAKKHDGYYLVKKDSKYQLLNVFGEEVTPAKYDYISAFKDGFSKVVVNKKTGLINKAGTEIAAPVYQIIEDFDEDLAKVRLNNKYGFINKSGKVTVTIKYDDANGFDGNVGDVKLGGKWGVINRDGTIVVPFKYDDVIWWNSNHIGYTKINNLFGYINIMTAKEITAFKYTSVRIFNTEGLAKVGIDNKYGYINLDGTEVIPVKYDALGDFRYGLVGACLFDKCGYLDNKGEIAVNFNYDSVWQFHENNLARVTANGKFGFINMSGGIVVPVIYDYVGDFKNNKVEVRRDGNTLFYDVNGNIVD